MRLVQCTADHIKGMSPSKWQPNLDMNKILINANEISDWDRTYVALDGDDVLGVGGILDVSQGRAMAWAIMGEMSKGKMYAISKHVKAFIDYHIKGINRLETLVKSDFVVGRKWVEFLGFEFESDMRRFSGQDTYSMYVRFGDG